MSLQQTADTPKLQAAASSQDDSTAEARADIAQLAAEDSVWWRAVCIPGWMWRKVAVHEPVSSSLQIAGVNVLLKEYGHIPAELPDKLDRVEPSSSSTSTVATSSGFDNGAPSASSSQQQQGPFKLGFAAAGLKPDPPPALGRPSPVRITQTAAQPPTVIHILLRQWGAEVSVSILPVGWSKPKQPEQLQPTPEQVSAPGQPSHPHTNPHGFARLNSIWESPEASEAGDSSPTQSSVKSLFQGHPSIQKSAAVQKGQAGEQHPESPGAAFTHRQSNPLCMYFSHTRKG